MNQDNKISIEDVAFKYEQMRHRVMFLIVVYSKK